jgi:hypothetical protein
MYYIGISESNPNQISYYCRNCKHKDETITEEGVCVLNKKINTNEQNFSHIVNKYTKMDPTLPRIYNMKCPNEQCITNKEKGSKPTEIIYLRYDDNNLKYVYVCVDCDFVWKTSENK